MKKALILDGYGTLFFTGTDSVDAAGKVLAKRGRFDLDAKEFYARWKQIHRQHLEAPGTFLTEEVLYHRDLRELYAEYAIEGDPDEDVQIMLDILGNRTAYPEVKEVLEKLSHRMTLCIGSTSDTAPLLQDLERSGLPVSRVFTSEGLRVYKPHRSFYRSILKQLGLEASQTLFVGDSLRDDVFGPQRVGMQACWVNRKGEQAEDVTPDFEIRDLRGLPELVDALL